MRSDTRLNPEKDSVSLASARKLRLRYIRSVLRAAIRSHDQKATQKITLMLQLSHMGSPDFPEKHFRLLLGVIRMPQFIARAGPAEAVFQLVMLDWHKLSFAQRVRLLREVSTLYPRIRPIAASICFVISELLGKYFCNHAALETILRLESASREHARAFIPHALEHLAIESKDATVRLKASKELEHLASDDSPTVRNEVAQAVAKVRAVE